MNHEKAFFAFLFSGLVFAALLFLSNNALTAYAVNDFGFEVERLDTAITVKGQNVPADSLKITLTISNSTGYCNGGIGFPYDSEVLSVITQSNNSTQPLFDEGLASIGLMIYSSFNPEPDDPDDPPNVSFGIVGMEDNTVDGDVISFFLMVSDNSHTLDDYNIEDLVSPPYIISLSDENSMPVDYTLPTEFEYTVPISYTFMLGDVNGDGYVTVEDVLLIQQLVYSNGGNPLDVDGTYTVSSTTYPGLYISINGTPTLVLRVADADIDGDVDEDDAYAVLGYYTEHIVSGRPYNGEIGEMQTHITYIIQFSTN